MPTWRGSAFDQTKVLLIQRNGAYRDGSAGKPPYRLNHQGMAQTYFVRWCEWAWQSEVAKLLENCLWRFQRDRWTSYGEPGSMIGTTAQQVGVYIANNLLQNAYGVLRSYGKNQRDSAGPTKANPLDPHEFLTWERIEYSPAGRATDKVKRHGPTFPIVRSNQVPFFNSFIMVLHLYSASNRHRETRTPSAILFKPTSNRDYHVIKHSQPNLDDLQIY